MYTIILAGGSGTRLFPLSRSSYPKQFIPLFKDESLFQKTVKRALIFSKPDEIYIVTNESHKFHVINQLKQINADCNILTEPCGKNTLPAILYAVNKISEKNYGASVLVLPSDQLIKTDESYKTAIESAEKLSISHLATFGIIPTSAHTGYGYIKPGIKLTNGFEIDKFVEKPDLHTAQKYLKDGYLWNAGMFCFSVKIFKEECKKLSPDVYNAFEKDVNDAYKITPKISVDYGIMEKTDKAVVVPLSSEWSDVGSFDALYSVKDKNESNNAVDGEYISYDGKNNLIISDRLVSTIGISGTAIIETPDVLLVCPRNMSQSAGKIAELLQEKGDVRASLHTTVHRPWGVYTTLMKTDNYQIKRLTLNPHNRISLQYHNHRSEHWVVVEGTAEVIKGDKTLIVNVGESTFVPKGTLHRLSNKNDEILTVIEVQYGDYIGEDDIIRCDDDFERL